MCIVSGCFAVGVGLPHSELTNCNSVIFGVADEKSVVRLEPVLWLHLLEQVGSYSLKMFLDRIF